LIHNGPRGKIIDEVNPGMINDYVEVMKKAPLFRDIASDDLKAMLGCLKPVYKSYRRHEFITLAGEPFTGIGLLLEGEASISKETLAGDRVVLNLIVPGDMFGEIIAFSGESVWPANVQALEESMAMFLPREGIVSPCMRTCPFHRTLIQNLLMIVSDRALMLNKKLEYLTIRSMRGRICAFLLDQYKKRGTTTFTLDMNRNEMADFLNVSRPSMSRELGRMREDGLIDFHLSTVRILDLEAMMQALAV